MIPAWLLSARLRPYLLGVGALAVVAGLGAAWLSERADRHRREGARQEAIRLNGVFVTAMQREREVSMHAADSMKRTLVADSAAFARTMARARAYAETPLPELAVTPSLAPTDSLVPLGIVNRGDTVLYQIPRPVLGVVVAYQTAHRSLVAHLAAVTDSATAVIGAQRGLIRQHETTLKMDEAMIAQRDSTIAYLREGIRSERRAKLRRVWDVGKWVLPALAVGYGAAALR